MSSNLFDEVNIQLLLVDGVNIQYHELECENHSISLIHFAAYDQKKLVFPKL